MKKLFEEFKSLSSDIERWKWLLNHQSEKIRLTLDNDDTFVVFGDPDEDIESVHFDSWIGNSEGVFDLLESIGIKAYGC